MTWLAFETQAKRNAAWGSQRRRESPGRWTRGTTLRYLDHHLPQAQALRVDPVEPRGDDHVAHQHVALARHELELQLLAAAAAHRPARAAALHGAVDGGLAVEQQHGLGGAARGGRHEPHQALLGDDGHSRAHPVGASAIDQHRAEPGRDVSGHQLGGQHRHLELVAHGGDVLEPPARHQALAKLEVLLAQARQLTAQGLVLLVHPDQRHVVRPAPPQQVDRQGHGLLDRHGRVQQGTGPGRHLPPAPAQGALVHHHAGRRQGDQDRHQQRKAYSAGEFGHLSAPVGGRATTGSRFPSGGAARRASDPSRWPRR